MACPAHAFRSPTSPRRRRQAALHSGKRRLGVDHASADHQRGVWPWFSAFTAVSPSPRRSPCPPDSKAGKAGCSMERNTGAARFRLRSHRCVDESAFRCVWPERLTLSARCAGRQVRTTLAGLRRKLGASAGQFRALAAGRARERWAGAVVMRDGFPVLRLAPGSHAVIGTPLLVDAPGVHLIDPRTALVDLTLDGTASRSRSGPMAPSGSASAAAPSSPSAWRCRSIDSCATRCLWSSHAHPPASGGRCARGASRPRAAGASLRSASKAAGGAPRAGRPAARAGAARQLGDHAGRARQRVRQRSSPDLHCKGRWAREEIWSFRERRPAAHRGCRRRSKASIRRRPTFRPNGAAFPRSAWRADSKLARRRAQPRFAERGRQSPEPDAQRYGSISITAA